MARRKHPWYKPVNHRVTDKYRGVFANAIYSTINLAITFVVVWFGAWIAIRGLTSWSNKTNAETGGKIVDQWSFADWVSMTMEYIINPAIEIIKVVFQAIVEGTM